MMIETRFTSLLKLSKACMLYLENDIETYGISHAWTCIFRDVFLLFIFYAQVDHRNVSSVMSLLEYFLQKPAKRQQQKKWPVIVIAHSLQSRSPRNAHTESHSTGIGLVTLGRRRICCVLFCSQFLPVYVCTTDQKLKLCEPVTKRRC